MSHPKRGDVVLYSQGVRTYNALVLAANTLTMPHLGKNGEPTLHLAVLFDDVQSGVSRQPGSIPEPSIVHDVVHASHEFDAAYMESHGLRKVIEGDPNKVAAETEIRNRRGAGEWKEATVVLGSESDLYEPRPETAAEERSREAAEQAEEDEEDKQP